MQWTQTKNTNKVGGKRWAYLTARAGYKTIKTKGKIPESDKDDNVQDDVIKWKHFPALLAFCARNTPVTGEFPSQRPVTLSLNDVFFDLRLNQQLSKQWRRR